MVGYNLNCGYPINTYAEVFVCYLQDIVLVALIYRWGLGKLTPG
jgi:hypothetical protein